MKPRMLKLIRLSWTIARNSIKSLVWCSLILWSFSDCLSDSILGACVHKVDDAIYELESPSQAGNLNSTPEYTLSMIEKSLNNATDFATIYNLYLGGEPGGDHVDVIKSANEFA